MAIVYKSKKMKAVLDHFGGTLVNLAKLLNVSPAAVCKWMAAGYFPADRAIAIERMTNGLFKAVDLAK